MWEWSTQVGQSNHLLPQNNPKYSKIVLKNHLLLVQNIPTLSVLDVTNPVLTCIIQWMGVSIFETNHTVHVTQREIFHEIFLWLIKDLVLYKRKNPVNLPTDTGKQILTYVQFFRLLLGKASDCHSRWSSHLAHRCVMI